MGQHRGAGQVRRVGGGPIIGVLAVVLIVVLVFGWLKVRDVITNQGNEAAGACVDGNSTLAVTADPDIAPQIQQAADRYNATQPVVRDQCVTVSVAAKPSQLMESGLAGGSWDEGALGPKPALWIPQSMSSSQKAAAVDGLVKDEPKSITSSPVVLAVQPILQEALTRAKVGWQDLPRLQGDANALAPLGLPGWGGLRLVLPAGPLAGSSRAAVEAVAASVSNAGQGPVGDDAADSPDVASAVSTLAAGAGAATGDKPATATAALAFLSAQTDRGAAPFHAVAATAQQIGKVANGSDKITTYAPGGPTPVADYPATMLAGNWVDETQSRAAALFADFLRQPDQTKAFTDAGFDGTTPENALRRADSGAQDRLAQLVANPQLGASATVLLDVTSSMATTDGSGTRLSNSTKALRDRLRARTDLSTFSLWEYSKMLDGTSPYRVAVGRGPLEGRLDSIDRELQSATTGAGIKDSTYLSVIAAYKAAAAAYAPGQTNSLLVITDGPDDDSDVSGEQLIDQVAAATTPDKPIRVDVIVVGPGPADESAASTMKALTQRTGGQLQNVRSTAGKDLSDAVAKVLG